MARYGSLAWVAETLEQHQRWTPDYIDNLTIDHALSVAITADQEQRKAAYAAARLEQSPLLPYMKNPKPINPGAFGVLVGD